MRCLSGLGTLLYFFRGAGPVRNAPERSWHASGPSLSAFRGSPETPEMLCGLRLQGPLLMHPAVALGSALTARGPSGGPFRALPGAHWAGPLGPPWVGPFGPKSSSRILTSSLFIVKRRRGKAIGRFWALLPKWLSGYLWRFILSISGPCCPNGSQEASGGSF